MIRLFSLFLGFAFLVGGLNVYAQQASELSAKGSYPTNLNANNFKKIKKFKDKLIAFEGIVAEIKVSKNKTPFYKIYVGDNNFIWAVMMLNNDVTKVGNVIKVLGYLNQNRAKYEGEEYIEGKFIVLGIGHIDVNNKSYLFPKDIDAQRQEWEDGKIPAIIN